MTAKQQAKFRTARLVERVKLARPIAQELLVFGVGSPADDERIGDRHLLAYLERLAGGDLIPGELLETDKGTAVEDVATAAYALGIAIGLFLRPEMFESSRGGAR